MARITLNLFYSVILIVLLIGIGCNKDSDRIIIEGTVTDFVQKQPVEGAEVLLIGKEFQGGTYNPNPSVLAMISTDSEGRFSFNLEQVKASDFEIVVRKDRYFEFSEPLTTNEIASGKTYKPAYTIHPEGWIRLLVQNTFPLNSSDLISYRIISDNPVCSNCCNSAYVQGSGMTYSAVVLCRTKGETKAQIVWNVHKGGGSAPDSASVSIPLFDTAFYHLQY